MLFNLRKTKEKSQYVAFMPRLFALFIDVLLFTLCVAPILELASNLFIDHIDRAKLQQDLLSVIPQNKDTLSGEEVRTLFIEWLRLLDESGMLLALQLSYSIQFLLFSIALIVFWFYKSATPGKLLFRMRIVDAKTHAIPTKKQWILRYLGYVISTLAGGLGFFWIGANKKKQGWHDMISGTAVVYKHRLEKNSEIEQDDAAENAE